jgi:hypothetical protein
MSTVEVKDIHPGDLVYDDYIVENCQLHFSDKQRWFYLRDQTPEEAWVFIQSDSKTIGIKQGVPHSAFPLPNSGKTELPRESIEIRCLVYIN